MTVKTSTKRAVEGRELLGDALAATTFFLPVFVLAILCSAAAAIAAIAASQASIPSKS
jgi:hypothetical protein